MLRIAKMAGDAILSAALSCAAAGLSVIPDRLDSKAPAIAWREFQENPADESLIRKWFPGHRLGVVCGYAGVEMIDFDAGGAQYDAWVGLIGWDNPLLEKLYIERTPRGGRHVAYRCLETAIPGNQKLSESATRETLIETRGTGGQFVAHPSEGYELEQGSLDALPVLTKEERAILIESARALTEFDGGSANTNERGPTGDSDKPRELREDQPCLPSAVDSPAEEYNQTHDFRQTLEALGWKHLYARGDRDYYTRPGKDAKEVSATVTNGEVFYCFSSNAAPFEPDKGYSKFQVYALLEHRGDTSAAAKAVVQARKPETTYRLSSGGSLGPVAGAGLPSGVTPLAATSDIDKLLDFDRTADQASILGNRWLCEGAGMLLIGQSGIGKSTLAVQAVITWSYGKPLFGIKPRGPLKFLLIQAENDDGDIAEMMQDVLAGMGIDKDLPETREHLRNKLVIAKESTRTGAAFCAYAHDLIEKHKPDIVIADPLLSYIGDDISRQDSCSRFLRNGLNPILQETRVGWIWTHHTGKPPKDAKSQSAWTDDDYSYWGTGSSDLTNWARGIAVVRRVHESDPIYNFKITKRGNRAGMLDSAGRPSLSIHLSHSRAGSCWLQVGSEQASPTYTPKPKYTNNLITKDREALYQALAVELAEEQYNDMEAKKRVARVIGCKEPEVLTHWAEVQKRMKSVLNVEPEKDVWWDRD